MGGQTMVDPVHRTSQEWDRQGFDNIPDAIWIHQSAGEGDASAHRVIFSALRSSRAAVFVHRTLRI